MKFTIILPPKAQKRARGGARLVRGGGKKGQDIAIPTKPHTEKDQRTEQAKLMTLMYDYRPPAPLEGPILFGLKVFLPIPKKSKKWQAAARAGEIRPTTKPDLDNLIKQIKDCAKGIFWLDDKQVVEYLSGTGKWYGDVPRWEVEIRSLEEAVSGKELSQTRAEWEARHRAPSAGGLF